jgi:hypothetical protein
MAQCLAERLGYPTLGREVVQEAAAGLGVPASLLEEKMGDRPTVWGRFSSLRRAYIAAVQSALAERAAEGRLVYHGLAGGMLLQGVPGTLCIRLIAPLERRIRAVMAESGMDAVMAEQFIHEVDESRARWVRVMYGEDIMDPALYDLVISLETMTVEGACALTAKVLGQPEYELTDEVLAKLGDFRLACRVRVGLAADAELRPLELDTEAERGVVTVTGRAPLRKNNRTGNRIVEIARSVPGVESVRLKVEWYDPYP